MDSRERFINILSSEFIAFADTLSEQQGKPAARAFSWLMGSPLDSAWTMTTEVMPSPFEPRFFDALLIGLYERLTNQQEFQGFPDEFVLENMRMRARFVIDHMYAANVELEKMRIRADSFLDDDRTIG